jgi:hypothetical protein
MTGRRPLNETSGYKCRQQLLQAAFPIREQVDVFEFALHHARHAAHSQTRNQKGRVAKAPSLTGYYF